MMMHSARAPVTHAPECVLPGFACSRQSLRFMLDSELAGQGGHRRHFWVPYRAPGGLTFWYSPVFQRACLDVPPAPCGGILAEEMVRVCLIWQPPCALLTGSRDHVHASACPLACQMGTPRYSCKLASDLAPSQDCAGLARNSGNPA